MRDERGDKVNKARFEYLDIAKAILIITVLLVHCIDPEGKIPFWAKLFCSFNMPLFFAICGVTSHKAQDYSLKDFWDFLGRNAFALILPYFIWGLIYSPFNLKAMGVLLYGSGNMIIANGAGNNQCWFLPCLFLARVGMYGIIFIEQKIYRYRVPVLFLFSAVSFAIGFLAPMQENGYPWCADIAFVAMGFMILAHLNSDYLNAMDRKPIWLQGVLAIGTGTLLLLGNLYGATDVTGFVSMCTSEYGNVFWFLFNALAGTVCVRSTSSMIARIDIFSRLGWFKKAMNWLGQNTMGIFIIHMPFTVMYIVGTLPAILKASSSVFWVALICASLMLAFSTIITILINSVCPELLGRHREREER